MRIHPRERPRESKGHGKGVVQVTHIYSREESVQPTAWSKWQGKCPGAGSGEVRVGKCTYTETQWGQDFKRSGTGVCMIREGL